MKATASKPSGVGNSHAYTGPDMVEDSKTLFAPSSSDVAVQRRKVSSNATAKRQLERRIFTQIQPTPHPGIFSSIFFVWPGAIIKLGYKRNQEGKGLEPDDLWELRPQFQGRNVKDVFESYWQDERRRPKPSITRALWRLVYRLVITSGFFELIRIVASFANPLILKVF